MSLFGFLWWFVVVMWVLWLVLVVDLDVLLWQFAARVLALVGLLCSNCVVCYLFMILGLLVLIVW